MAEERDPSLVVVAVSGLAVLVVVAFVAALVFGSRPQRSPGERIAVVRSSGPAGVTVLAGRCLDQRVTEVSMSGPGGALWRITSGEGSIERRYVVGEVPPPLGFRQRVGLAGVRPGPATFRVRFSREGHPDGSDAVEVDPTDIGRSAPELGDAAPPCAPSGGPGAVTSVLFVIGALVVVAAYGTMVVRRWGRWGRG
ncbi:MAG: hypothetical protein JF603_07310 [Acidobacteria bacterium]|nr:hypothetical protein [Acidobacteriota bacterium]